MGSNGLEHPGHDADIRKSKWSTHLIGMPERDPMFLDIRKNSKTNLHEIWVPDLRREVFYFQQIDRAGREWRMDSFPFFQRGWVGR